MTAHAKPVASRCACRPPVPFGTLAMVAGLIVSEAARRRWRERTHLFGPRSELDHPDLPAVIGAALNWASLDDDDRAALLFDNSVVMSWADALVWASESMCGRAAPDEIHRRAVQAVDRWLDARPRAVVVAFISDAAVWLGDEARNQDDVLAIIYDIIGNHLEAA